MAIAWQSRGNHMAITWQSRGNRAAIPWQSRGNRAAIPWQSHDNHVAIAWQSRAVRLRHAADVEHVIEVADHKVVTAVQQRRSLAP
eukprot:41032-Prymnesium_polylepis.1